MDLRADGSINLDFSLKKISSAAEMQDVSWPKVQYESETAAKISNFEEETGSWMDVLCRQKEESAADGTQQKVQIAEGTYRHSGDEKRPFILKWDELTVTVYPWTADDCSVSVSGPSAMEQTWETGKGWECTQREDAVCFSAEAPELPIYFMENSLIEFEYSHYQDYLLREY